MSKKILFMEKPNRSKSLQSADQWVESRTTQLQEQLRMKRLTLDISEHLHSRIKSSCAKRGLKMVDEIRTLLESSFKD
jgi:predicted DNA binding CopG/RHH family protein